MFGTRLCISNNNSKSMNIEQFIRKYQPLEKNGEIRQYDWTVPDEWEEVKKAAEQNKVCTVVEEEDVMYLTNGLHYVNRQFYVITKHEIEETNLIVEY